jgi:hypothetical protein
MAEADENALVVRRKITRTACDPAHHSAIAQRDGNLGSYCVSITSSPLQIETDPVIAFTDIVAQQHRRTIESCKGDIRTAIIVEVADGKASPAIGRVEYRSRLGSRSLEGSSAIVMEQ